MTSIAFTTLFLGLVMSVQTLGVNVDGPVGAVEYVLDGKPIGRSSSRPWSARIDLGSDLSPHELVARALDREGREIARTRQWLNLPRPRAETAIVLERDARGRAIAARLSTQSLFGSRPNSVSVTLDGRPITPGEGGRIVLPDYEPGRTHLLSAELEFAEGARSRADVVLGGDTGEEAKSELTALPVKVRNRGDLPNLRELQSCLQENGRPLTVVAVEDGPAQVIVVRDRGNREIREVLGGGARFFLPGESERFFGDIRLDGKDRLRFVWPVAQRFADPVLASDLFGSTTDYTMSSGSFHWLLTRAYMPHGAESAQRYTDAAAVAGLEAFASSTRRAVVVVLGSGADSSRLSPEQVRSYLERLRVPLFVWSLVETSARPEFAKWGPVVEIDSAQQLRKAVRDLKRNLESQYILWIDGKHLPQEISLTEKAAALLELAGSR
ncbi:MAG TPA: hypothetical protein VFW15_16305 [Thermoanaerobaculia bacterium]|nr:hypothetical protein [Thermoanaerobaculia bacterium]